MPDKSQAVIAVKGSIKIDVEAGETYAWCACGKSSSQPFCDGSHSGTGFSPVIYTADETKRVGFCGCKQSSISPLCDGTHKSL